MKNAIVYSSRTGNTRLLAETVRKALPEDSIVYFGEPNSKALEADRIYVGFWTDKGTCDSVTADFLNIIEDREVFFFGTAGFGGDPEYFEKILKRTEKHLKKSVKVVGSFFCQGKMPMSVRERYENMLKNPVHMPGLENMIRNFDQALTHPDTQDLQNAEEAVKASL